MRSGVSHESPDSSSAESTTARAPALSTASSGTAFRSPLEPVRALAGERERAGGRLRVGKRDDRRAGLGEDARRAVRADHDRYHGLLSLRGTDCAPDRGGNLVRARHDRRHEDHDQRIDVRVVEHARNHGLIGRRGRRAEQVDGVGEARFTGNNRSQRRAGLVGQLRKLEAPALAGVGAEDAQAARVRDHADPASPGQRLRRENGSSVDELLERSRSQHAGLAEQGVDGRVGARERRRVRARGARSCRGRSGLQGENRLAAGDAPSDAGERPRVSERLEIEQDEIGRLVVLPPLEQVVRRDIGLVADRDERGEPECTLGRFLEQREPESAAL